jgi:hypothetical protein
VHAAEVALVPPAWHVRHGPFEITTRRQHVCTTGRTSLDVLALESAPLRKEFDQEGHRPRATTGLGNTYLYRLVWAANARSHHPSSKPRHATYCVQVEG